MSKADNNFIQTCKTIINEGFSNVGENVRPKWPDGTPAYTQAAINVVNKYDLSEEFPAVTLRKTFIKSAMDELLWIWQRKSNNVNDLNSHVWDEWADNDGSIGLAYGYQLRKNYLYTDVSEKKLMEAFPGGRLHAEHGMTRFIVNENVYATHREDMNGWYMDQVNKALYDLKTDPFSRRIIVSMRNVEDLHMMNLEPCAYSMTFMVSKQKDSEQLVLNGLLNQRSNDILAAGAWNVAQYALLIMMFAQVCGMKPGNLTHVIANAHIYDRHIPLIEELITRTPQPAPKVWLDPNIDDFYAFTTDNLHIENYQVGGEQIKNIPIAI